MHEETYPAFFTPRDEEPSLSSSEEKSSKFDWLERKLTKKQKYEGKTKQVLCKIYFFLPPITWLFCKEIYKTIYMGLFTLCSYLKTKESSDRCVTRRVWGFRHRISKAKYLKMSVANIGKLQENTAVVHVWPGKRYQRIRTCLTGEVETSSSPIRHQVPDVKYPIRGSGHVWPDRIPGVRYPRVARGTICVY